MIRERVLCREPPGEGPAWLSGVNAIQSCAAALSAGKMMSHIKEDPEAQNEKRVLKRNEVEKKYCWSIEDISADRQA